MCFVLDSHKERRAQMHTSMLTAVVVCVLAQGSAAHKREKKIVRDESLSISILSYNANDDTTFTSNFLLNSQLLRRQRLLHALERKQ